MLSPDRYFDPHPGVRAAARALYNSVAHLPLICPHGHVDPRMLAGNIPFPDPASFLVIPDHYVVRMLYSRGIAMERLGIPRVDGAPVETDARKIWKLFAEHFYLFRGTPTGCWIKHELEDVFGISLPLNGQNADSIFDDLSDKLAQPEFLPRALYERFRIEILCTTDAASDTLEYHQQIRASGWKADIRPTFRPDLAIHLLHPDWPAEIRRLGELTGREIKDYGTFIRALEQRRAYFKEMGATATDHAVLTPHTHELARPEVETIFECALHQHASREDAAAFAAHMLMEMARMSCDDGLVMQLHPGSYRNHNQLIYDRFGADRGCDIPVATEYTRNLWELLNKYGNHPNYRLVLFTLDESTYSRELAPLAGHYPAVRLGPPWWFHDSIQGMTRFRYAATETAGIYNTAGFNDDTRAFASIPARHDLCRRVDANFLADQVARGVIEMEEAEEMIADLSAHLVRETYRFA